MADFTTQLKDIPIRIGNYYTPDGSYTNIYIFDSENKNINQGFTTTTPIVSLQNMKNEDKENFHFLRKKDSETKGRTHTDLTENIQKLNMTFQLLKLLNKYYKVDQSDVNEPGNIKFDEPKKDKPEDKNKPKPEDNGTGTGNGTGKPKDKPKNKPKDKPKNKPKDKPKNKANGPGPGLGTESETDSETDSETESNTISKTDSGTDSGTISNTEIILITNFSKIINGFKSLFKFNNTINLNELEISKNIRKQNFIKLLELYVDFLKNWILILNLKPEQQTQTPPEPQTQPQLETQPEPQPQTQLETQPQPQLETQPETKLENIIKKIIKLLKTQPPIPSPGTAAATTTTGTTTETTTGTAAAP